MRMRIPSIIMEESLGTRLNDSCTISNVLHLSPVHLQWGEGGVPAMLVSRYAEELDQPPENVALVVDEIRGQELKDMTRDFVRITYCAYPISVTQHISVYYNTTFLLFNTTISCIL